LAGKDYVGPEVDIWSLGVLLYFMASGKRPFDDPSAFETLRKIKKSKKKKLKTASPPCQDLIHQMLRVDPIKRISMIDIGKHTFFVVKRRGTTTTTGVTGQKAGEEEGSTSSSARDSEGPLSTRRLRSKRKSREHSLYTIYE